MRYGAESGTLRRAIASHKTTLRRLHEVGVRSAGADQYRSSARGEVQHVLEHDCFDDETLLTLWAETTPQVVFPDRKIGRLDPGYEASFLVLGTDPTADLWAAANDIRRGVKESRQGIGEDE